MTKPVGCHSSARAASSSGSNAAATKPRRRPKSRDDQWFTKYEFDAVLLSAGGNDFVDTWLKETLSGHAHLTAAEAFEIVVASGRYEQVRQAYEFFVGAFHERRPDVSILAHTYDYPRCIGTAAALGLANLGVAAVLKKSQGPWIGPCLDRVVDGGCDAWRDFARLMINGFVDQVLEPVKQNPRFGGCFDYVDLRGQLTDDDDWFDEMHPTEAGFHQLAGVFRTQLIKRLPPNKR